MKRQIENIIKENLPKKNEIYPINVEKQDEKWNYLNGFNQALSQINPALIADEVLKVVVGSLDLEKLAELEHEQWCDWSKSIAEKEILSPERVERWQSLWIDYSKLAEKEKESDRKYARKILQLLSEHLSPNKENENNG